MKCWFFISTFMCLSRLFYRDIINHFNVKVKGRIFDSIIYGAGQAGALLSTNILRYGKYKIKFFVDDNSELWGREINGIKIHPPKYIEFNSIKIEKMFGLFHFHYV